MRSLIGILAPAKTLWLSLLITFGCATTQPLGLGVYSPMSIDPMPELPAEVVEACEVWGVECYVSDKPTAILEIVPRPTSGDDPFWPVAGRAFGCLPHARAIPHAYVIAHELGHLLGLDHSTDPSNLMYPTTGDDADISEAQLEHVHSHRGIGLLRRKARACRSVE